LLDSLSTGILVIDLAGNLQIANRSAYRLVGSAAVTLGKLLPEELRLAFQVPLERTDELTLEHDVSWGEMVLAVQSVPFQDQQGGTGGAICLARDVTQERMMEQQVLRVEKMAAIGELAAGAAHEIRNPLTAIRGFIQLLQARSQRANGDYYQIIINEIDRIDEIIHDLLLLARPSELHRVETSLSDLVEEVLLLHHSEFGRQSIRLTRHYDEILGTILVDPKMFRQILLNLLRNAVQAMPNGGHISVTIQVRDAEHVALAIADTGAGISAENLRRLFDPFFTTKEEGTGLGLSLCYSIVQAHQGHIDVESKLGEGTTFTIILPMH
jgi:signal transduction histidine kinase